MNEQETPWEIAARRRAHKAKRRAERAERVADMEAAWLRWMYAEASPELPAESTELTAEQLAERAAKKAAYRANRATTRAIASLTDAHYRDAAKALASGREFPDPKQGRATPTVNTLICWLDRERPLGGEFDGPQVAFMRDTYRAAVLLLADRTS